MEVIEREKHHYREVPLSYSEREATRGNPPQGYVVDRASGQLGRGEECFDKACAAMNQWQHLQLGWVEPVCPDTPIKANTEIGIMIRCLGLRFLNFCRVVYLIDESTPIRRYGYAYGTLCGHAECGEERFQIEWRGDDSVWYEIFAFSKPARWYSRLGYPLVPGTAETFRSRFHSGAQRYVSLSVSMAQLRGFIHDPTLNDWQRTTVNKYRRTEKTLRLSQRIFLICGGDQIKLPAKCTPAARSSPTQYSVDCPAERDELSH